MRRVDGTVRKTERRQRGKLVLAMSGGVRPVRVVLVLANDDASLPWLRGHVIDSAAAEQTPDAGTETSTSNCGLGVVLVHMSSMLRRQWMPTTRLGDQIFRYVIEFVPGTRKA